MVAALTTSWRSASENYALDGYGLARYRLTNPTGFDSRRRDRPARGHTPDAQVHVHECYCRYRFDESIAYGKP